MGGKATIVIGADSFVGSRLIEKLQAHGHKTYGTTRRRDTLSPERIFFDFSTPGESDFPKDAGRAIIVAAAIDYAGSASQPQSHEVNVVHTPRLVGRLLARGMYVLFVSSNSVFGGELAWPAEEAPHDARFPYAIQKDLAEKGILREAGLCQAQDRLAIVRLTKVLDRSTSPIPAWLKSWSQNEPVRPFADFVFAPVSRDFAANALAVIAEKEIPGPLHISGAENINYLDFAKVLAKALKIDSALIEPTTAVAEGVEIPFKPRFSGLGMERTTRLSGLMPQSVSSVINDIFASAQGVF